MLELSPGREAAVQAEDLALHQGCEGQEVEHLGEVCPDGWTVPPVLPLTLVVEPVDLGHLPALVVPPQHGDPLLVPHLQRFSSIIVVIILIIIVIMMLMVELFPLRASRRQTVSTL